MVKQHVCWINTQFCVYFWLNKKKATKEVTSKAKTTAFFLPRGLFPRLTLLLSCAFCCCLRCSECVGFCFGANAGNGVDCRRIIINKQHSLTHTRILCVFFSPLLYSLRICFGHTVPFVCCWARTNTMMQCRIERKKKFLPKMLFFFCFRRFALLSSTTANGSHTASTAWCRIRPMENFLTVTHGFRNENRRFIGKQCGFSVISISIRNNHSTYCAIFLWNSLSSNGLLETFWNNSRVLFSHTIFYCNWTKFMDLIDFHPKKKAFCRSMRVIWSTFRTVLTAPNKYRLWSERTRCTSYACFTHMFRLLVCVSVCKTLVECVFGFNKYKCGLKGKQKHWHLVLSETLRRQSLDSTIFASIRLSKVLQVQSTWIEVMSCFFFGRVAYIKAMANVVDMLFCSFRFSEFSLDSFYETLFHRIDF